MLTYMFLPGILHFSIEFYRVAWYGSREEDNHRVRTLQSWEFGVIAIALFLSFVLFFLFFVFSALENLFAA